MKEPVAGLSGEGCGSRALFPAVAPGVILHQQPYGMLVRAPARERGFRPDIYEANVVGSEILVLCDGSTSLEALIRTVRRRVDDTNFEPVESTRAFIVEALSRGILELHDGPVVRRLRTTGSAQYFSPSHMAVEVTDACNLRCQHCYRDSGPECDERLPTVKLLEVLSAMADHGVATVELTGGEPTCHPDIHQILQECLHLFGTVALLSNGWLIDETFVERLGRCQDKLCVQIDLDGDSPLPHDRLRGVPGAFANAVRAISLLVRHGVIVRAAMNVYPGNWRRLRPTLELAKGLGADGFAIAPLMALGRGRHMSQLSPDQFAVIATEAELLAQAHAGFFTVSEEMERKIAGQTGNCGAGSRSMVLGPTGRVRPCLTLDERYLSLGDLTRTSYADFLRLAPTGDFYHLKAPDPRECGDCSFCTFCANCIVAPIHARLAAQDQGEELSCSWNAATRFMQRVHFPRVR